MRTVLVIDDEPQYLSSVQAMLRSRGYATEGAATAQEGIAAARSHLPHLIISDINLTDGDGFSLLSTLRNDPRTATIPVVLMTGMTDVTNAREGMKLGADDFLQKPFKAEWLLETVAAQLKKREKILQQADQTRTRLVAILEAMPDLVAIVDAKTRGVVYLNQAGRRIVEGDGEEDLAGCHLEDFYTAATFEQLAAEALPVAIREGKWRGECEMKTTTGGSLPVWQLIQAHEGPDGEVEFFSTVAHDLTEENAAEQERHRVEIQLRHAQKLESIGQLAAGIAHEINTPTQFIGDNTRFLQDSFKDLAGLLQQFQQVLGSAKAGGVSPEQVAETERLMQKVDLDYLLDEVPKAIEQSLSGVDRISKIVRAMKEFSHPGTDEMTSIDLHHAIESTATVCRNEWKYVAELVTEFDATLPAVPCLPGELNQVILNLIVNAAHAIADRLKADGTEKGTITIGTRRNGDRVEIRIGDTGTGIPEKARDRIFEPFFTTKTVGKGTGQGLAISRSVIVDKHGGTIEFETETGRGTTFIISLPLTAAGKVATTRLP
jgi:two-component system, NtrC family, sensor kinase